MIPSLLFITLIPSRSCADTPAAMATYKIDDLVRDVSTQMANSQLTRRSSGQSHRTPNNLRRNAARVMKTNSAGSSPRNIERRKTVMSQAPTRHRSTLDDHYTNMLSFGGQQPITQDRQQPATRPRSWHPSSLAQGHSHGQPEPAVHQFRDSKRIQTTANSVSLPSSIQSNLYVPNPTILNPSLGAGYHTQQMMSNEYQQYPYAVGPDIYPYGPLSLSDPSANSSFYTRRGFYNPQDSSSVHSYNSWSGGPAAATFDVTTPSTPDILPIQHPPHPAVSSNWHQGSQLAKQSSKELVGMGLYDVPDSSTSFGSVGEPLQYFLLSQTGPYPLYQPTGKGLKLEETWQPPAAEENLDQADENYSSDGSEDEPPRASVHQGAPQVQLPLPTGPDLSNHTFYFENEDTYDGRVFLNETMSAIEAKVPVAGFDAFAWA